MSEARALWEIDADIERILSLGSGEEAVDVETGEILDADALDALDMELAEKVENCACWVKNQKALSEAIREEVARLTERRRAIDARVERLKRYMLGAVETAGGRVETARARVSTRRSSAVVVDCMEALPEAYVTQRVEVSPDKAAIRDAVGAGASVPGAHVEQRKTVVIK